MSSKHVVALLFGVLLGAAVFADAPATQPATQSSTEPTTQTGPFKATDNDALTKAIGTTATVTGTVGRTNWYNDQILFINFKGNKRGQFTVIARAENRDALDKAFDGDIAKAIAGKTISVTGKIIKYRESPEMQLTTPDQLTIIKEPTTTTAP